MKHHQQPATRPPTRPEPSPATGEPACPSRPLPLHLELARKLEGLPRDLGIVLLGLGTIGVAIPGPIPAGPSFVVLGAVCLRPGLLARFAGALAVRFPRLFRFLIGFVERLRIDLERRYPGSIGC